MEVEQITKKVSNLGIPKRDYFSSRERSSLTICYLGGLEDRLHLLNSIDKQVKFLTDRNELSHPAMGSEKVAHFIKYSAQTFR